MIGTITRRTTHVMSCNATVIAVAAGRGRAIDAAVERAVRRLHELELRWSRFIADSELSRVNRRAGHPVAVSNDTITLVEAMVHGWHATDGSFDPTLLVALVELGYAQSRSDAERRTSLPAGVARRGSPDEIIVDREAGTVRLPLRTTIDPGGIGKGLAADLVVADLLAAGAEGALVEIGGDLRLAGRPPHDAGWCVEVATGGPLRTVVVADGGVATSTSRLRSWRAGTERHHHLIDPATLRSSASDAVSCTVIAGTASWAEVFTKVAFTTSASTAIAALDRRHLAAAITTDTGELLVTRSWKEFER
jgi:thiamine biosynthesis lipoprotein